MKRPALLTRSYWSAKRLAILIGFLLTILGPIGAQFFVDPAQDLSRRLDEQAKDIAAKIDTLKNSQAQYFMFQQQGALVYALNAAGFGAPGSNERTTINNLYQLSLLSRSNAMRAVIGELAFARLLDYRSTADKYNGLIAAARKDFSLATYTAVDDFETATMAQANARMSTLQQGLLALNKAKGEADTLGSQRKLLLLVLVTLGSAFLLAANLISTREEKKADPAMPEEPAGEASPDRVAELTIATQLMETALAHARALDAGSVAGERRA